MNTEIYSVNLRIQSKYGKIRTKKTQYLDTYVQCNFRQTVICFLFVTPTVSNRLPLWKDNSSTAWKKTKIQLLQQVFSLITSPSTYFIKAECCHICKFQLPYIYIYIYIYIIFTSEAQRCSWKLRPAASLKKRLWHRCFPVNFVKFRLAFAI